MQSSSTLPPSRRVPALDGARTRGFYVQFDDPDGRRYGLPTYPYHWAPKSLYTVRQLRAQGLRPGGQSPAAQILWRRGLRVAFRSRRLRSVKQGRARRIPATAIRDYIALLESASPEETACWEQERHQQSSERICIEHAIAEPRQWRSLQRWTGRREYFEDTALGIAGLVSDRAAAR